MSVAYYAFSELHSPESVSVDLELDSVTYSFCVFRIEQ